MPEVNECDCRVVVGVYRRGRVECCFVCGKPLPDTDLEGADR